MFISRTISPTREQLKKLNWLSPAAWRILDLFDTKLAREWEIYVRPYMNGLRPDFVLLNPNIGIAVFKLSKEENPSQDEIFTIQKIAEQWKNDILELYCPHLGACSKYGNITSWVAITAGVIFPNAEDKRLPEYKYRDYRPILFKNDIDRGYISKIFPHHTIHRDYKHFMTTALAEELRSWLVFPDFMSDSIIPLNYKELDAKQKELINRDRTKSGYRRIRGAAGSGKSLILAIRAAKLAIEGKKVLIATYNITLWHYLRDLIIRALKAEFDSAKRHTHKPAAKLHKINLSAKSFSEYFRARDHIPSPYPQGENYEYEHFNNRGKLSVSDYDKNPLGNITFVHFHYWCKMVCCYDANQADSYLEVFKKNPLKIVLDEILPKLTLQYKQDLPPNYDAILLDEGQDYQPLWWQALRQDLKPDGEAMLVADRTQDIYGNGTAWTEERMEGAGFRGNWNELNISYRMPENLRQLAEIFVKDYIKNPDKILPEVKPITQHGESSASRSKLRWTQAYGNSLECCLAEIDYLLQQTGAKTKLANTDIIICVDSIGFGTALRNALRKKGVEVFDTFHDSHDADEQTRHEESKAKKMAFCLEGKTLPSYQNPAHVKEGKAAVKITTIASFKGYEAPIMLLYLENSAPELFYVAFTRIKERQEGSIFSIVCADPNFKDFGRKFPAHGGEFFDKTGFFNRRSINELNSDSLDDEVPF